MKTNKYFGRIIVSAALCLVVIVGLVSSVSAASSSGSKKSSSSNSNSSNSSSSDSAVKESDSSSGVQVYSSDSQLEIGTIVQLTGAGTSKVESATKKNVGHMYGVVVDPHKLPITFSSSNVTNETYVATNGTYKTLVSTQGGEIKAGDYVTLSAIDGVAMKADYTDKTVFGRAATDFNSKADSIGTVSLKDTTGKADKTVVLGIIPVAIDIRRNPNDKSTKANLPPFLQRLGQAIAEKPVGPLRIYLSVAITGLSIIMALVILYSGVRNSIYSIGRNPLSKKTIYRGLFGIILTSIIVLIVGLFAVYLLLKL